MLGNFTNRKKKKRLKTSLSLKKKRPKIRQELGCYYQTVRGRHNTKHQIRPDLILR